MSERYKWQLSTLPGWYIIELENAGIPLKFDVDKLTKTQMLTILALESMLELSDQGKVKILINGREVTYRYVDPCIKT